MKSTLYIVKIILVCQIFLYAFATSAMHKKEGISSLNIKNIKLRTGIIEPSLVLSQAEAISIDKEKHKNAFVATLNQIEETAEAFKQKDFLPVKLAQAKQSLPPLFHQEQILLLALDVSFSQQDSKEIRAQKFIRLGLLVRDMYDHENCIINRFGLVDNDITNRIPKPLFFGFVAGAFDCAARELLELEPFIPQDRQIDFNLSLAQILLWKITYAQKSLAYKVVDVSFKDNRATYGTKTKETISLIRRLLDRVEKLLWDTRLQLPVLYEQYLLDLINGLSKSEVYEMIKLHKKELDQLKAEPARNAYEELSRARGLIEIGNNPLDYFTAERIEQLDKHLRRHGVPYNHVDESIGRIKKIYALKKISDPKYFFNQEFLQKYLQQKGKISREKMAGLLQEKVDKMRKTIDQLDICTPTFSLKTN
jgi:hypothetical protein